jgi:UDP-glucose 4-epimerase
LTGGLGYLGGRLAQSLAATTRHEVTLATRRPGPMASPAENVRVVPIDWTRDADLENSCADMDAVVHLAGINAAECVRDPVAALEFNGLVTARLLRAAAKQGVTRFLYLSSAHVYGASLRGFVDERTCPQPLHPYATSHRAGEDSVRLARRDNTIEGVVARLSNAFGAPVHPQVDCWSLVTNDLCRQAVTGRQQVLRSAGGQRRDFIPMTEACRALAHLLVLPSARLGDGLFNVGGAWAPTVLEMAELIAERVAANLGFRPHVVPGTVDDGQGGDDLQYSLAKLAASGFEVRREAAVEELDRLIAFCAQHQGFTS